VPEDGLHEHLVPSSDFGEPLGVEVPDLEEKELLRLPPEEQLRHRLSKLEARSAPRLTTFRILQRPDMRLTTWSDSIASHSEEDLGRFFYMYPAWNEFFPEGWAGDHDTWEFRAYEEFKVGWNFMVRRSPLSVVQELASPSFSGGKLFMLKPFQHLHGVGMGFAMDYIALWCKAVDWLTVYIPAAKPFAYNYHYLVKSERYPDCFDQPELSRYLLVVMATHLARFPDFTPRRPYSVEDEGYDLQMVADFFTETTKQSHFPEGMSLQHLAVYGAQLPNPTPVLIDLFKEIRQTFMLRTAIIVDGFNWFNAQSAHDHPDTLKKLPAERLTIPRLFLDLLEDPPRNGAMIIGLDASVSRDKSRHWFDKVHKSWTVDRYNDFEFSQTLEMWRQYELINPVTAARKDFPGIIAALSNRIPKEVSKAISLF